jgi:hypothetical protein
VQALQQAKADGALAGRFEVDALPQPGRPFDRFGEGAPENDDSEATLEADHKSPLEVATPEPDLFSRQR